MGGFLNFFCAIANGKHWDKMNLQNPTYMFPINEGTDPFRIVLGKIKYLMQRKTCSHEGFDDVPEVACKNVGFLTTTCSIGST